MLQSELQFPLNLASSRENPQPEEKKEIQFLNYFATSEDFQDANVNLDKAQNKKIEEHYFTQADKFVQNFLREEKEPLNIIPKKPNMDLKRFLKPKFDKLSKRTDKAIVKLLKQKFQKDKEESEENKKKQEKKIEKSKLEIENENIKYVNPVYMSGTQVYDQELIDNEEIEVENNDGNQFLDEINADYNIFQKNIDDFEDSDSY